MGSNLVTAFSARKSTQILNFGFRSKLYVETIIAVADKESGFFDLPISEACSSPYTPILHAARTGSCTGNALLVKGR
jgi:hypothetical protein